MSIFFKYILFCVFATALNLYTQRIFLNYKLIELDYFYALLAGTLIGLLTKYILDKKFIFYNENNSVSNNFNKFFLYSFNGIFTTMIFWSFESFFYFFFGGNSAREVGAVIGLSIGYFLKYKLDKKFVFNE